MSGESSDYCVVPEAWRKPRDRVIGSRVGWGRRWTTVVGAGKDSRRVRAIAGISFMSERPISDRPRRLVDWLNPTGAKKVHSLIPSIRLRY